MDEQTKRLLAEVANTLEKLREYTECLWDEGPEGEGWQSLKLKVLNATAKRLIDECRKQVQ